MLFIICSIIEARIEYLTAKREEAIRKKDYDKAWILRLKIDKNIGRLSRCSYYSFWGV